VTQGTKLADEVLKEYSKHSTLVHEDDYDINASSAQIWLLRKVAELFRYSFVSTNPKSALKISRHAMKTVYPRGLYFEESLRRETMFQINLLQTLFIPPRQQEDQSVEVREATSGNGWV
jgi:hypothetical protein